MRATEELVLRLARRRERALGGLSSQGFDELLRAVSADPASFIDDPSDQAFHDLGLAIARFERDLQDDELLDDDAYAAHAEERRISMAQACDEIANACPECLDARTISLLMASAGPDEVLSRLLELDDGLPAAGQGASAVPGGSAWDDVFQRPRLRLTDTIARALVETARFRMAADVCDKALALCPSDELGFHRTMLLALARLEDEDRFYDIGRRFGSNDAWSYLANALLLYKLDRMPAARRALNGLATQCEGGAYALLRPIFVESYLPDRPAFEPGSFEEAVIAVHEADPIVVDTPDFVGWASEQAGFVEAAQSFASREGFDW